MFFFHPLVEDGGKTYNMFFGFNILIPTLFHINEFFKSKNKHYFFLFLLIIELFMILVYANRGCLLPIAFIFFYKLLLENKKRTAVLLPFVVICCFIIYLIGNTILESIANLFEQYGISSRTLWYFLSGEISDSTGRDEIWKNSIEMIKERPILGWGLGGEFYRLAALEGVVDVDNSFTPHNGVIQNLVSFGVLFGSIATLIIIRPYLKINCIKDIFYHDMVLIFGSAIIAMFYSASGFFTNPLAAMFLYLSYSLKMSSNSIVQKRI
jgi:O-antigen ligase